MDFFVNSLEWLEEMDIKYNLSEFYGTKEEAQKAYEIFKKRYTDKKV